MSSVLGRPGVGRPDRKAAPGSYCPGARGLHLSSAARSGRGFKGGFVLGCIFSILSYFILQL